MAGRLIGAFARYPLMTDCWHQLPERRPTFKTILERLANPDIVAAMKDDTPRNV